MLFSSTGAQKLLGFEPNTTATFDLEISCGAKGKGGKTAAFRPPGFSILVESDAIIPVLVLIQENCVEICA